MKIKALIIPLVFALTGRASLNRVQFRKRPSTGPCFLSL